MTLRRTLIIAGTCGLLACSGTRETAVAPLARSCRPTPTLPCTRTRRRRCSGYEQAYALARVKLQANPAVPDGLPRRWWWTWTRRC